MSLGDQSNFAPRSCRVTVTEMQSLDSERSGCETSNQPLFIARGHRTFGDHMFFFFYGGNGRGISRQRQSIKMVLLRSDYQLEGGGGGENIRIVRRPYQGDQINFVVTQLKSSTLPPPLPPIG